MEEQNPQLFLFFKVFHGCEEKTIPTSHRNAVSAGAPPPTQTSPPGPRGRQSLGRLVLLGWTKGQNASNKLHLMCFSTSRKRTNHHRLLESYHRTGHICSSMEAHDAPGMKHAGMVSTVMCLCLKFREIPSECFCNGPRKQNTMRRKHVKWKEAQSLGHLKDKHHGWECPREGH